MEGRILVALAGLFCLLLGGFKLANPERGSAGELHNPSASDIQNRPEETAKVAKGRNQLAGLILVGFGGLVLLLVVVPR